MQADETAAVVEEAASVTKPPKVSVCVVTYNQEKYIAQCLQSIVDQETDFDFEIIVGDDCSTDGTRDIVRGYSEKYPSMFRLFLHEKNIGAYENYSFVHEQATGKYVAHLDGDDYFLPGKLQAQAKILDQNEECNLIWTPVLIETAPGHYHEQNAYFKKYALNRSYTRSDLIKYGTIGANSSKMYRKRLDVEALPPPKFDLIDYFVNVIQVGNGVARFTGTKPLVVYRMGIGIASNGRNTKNLTLQSIEYLARIFPQNRLECSIASGFHVLADIKNKRSSVGLGLIVFAKTFHWRTVFALLVEIKFMSQTHFKCKI